MAFWPRKVVEAHEAAVVGAVSVPSDTSVDVSSGVRAQGWQVEAWRLWGSVGELHAPTSYISRIVSRRITWKVTDGAMELDDAASLAVLDEVMGTADLEEAVRLVTLGLQVTAEVWVIQTATGWDVLSPTTKGLGERVKAAKAAGLLALRVYDPDPSDPEKADGAFRTLLDPAEDLMTLSALSRAQSRSRIAQAGILIVPVEQKFDGGDPFGGGLEGSMTAAIKDIHSASAVAPIKVEMAADLIEKVRHVTFDRPFDDHVEAKVEQAIRRIALGLDAPPELLLGNADSNHWAAWVTQEETYRGTIAPLAEKVAGVLEAMAAAVNRALTVAPDPTELLARRSSVRDAIDAAKIGAVGLAYVRDSIGASDGDAATAEDLATISLLTGSSDTSDATLDQRPAAPAEPA